MATEQTTTEWPIGELSRRASVSASTLRYYEQIGLLPAPARVSGRRRYDASALERLAVISLAQRAGFTLAEIRTLLEGVGTAGSPSTRWRSLARAKLVEVDELIERATAMRALLHEGLECDCVDLESCPLLDEDERLRRDLRAD